MAESKQNNAEFHPSSLPEFPFRPQSSPKPSSLSDKRPRLIRNKSVQWADWELQDVIAYPPKKKTEALIDESIQTEIEPLPKGVTPLVDDMIQTSFEIGSIASRSRTSSMNTCTTLDEEEVKQSALIDLITHLEDTAALLREYLIMPQPKPEEQSFIKNEQTFFLLKYQIALVCFTQLVSILILTLFDSLEEDVRDTSYFALTIACGSVLQLLNMVLVSFATAVLSKQMMRYKVEGTLMAQTYLATVVTFAGLYFIIYRIDPNNWEFGTANKIEDNVAFGQYIKMLYLSVSAATLCGAANIQPNKWHVTLLVSFQNVVNFVYSASILAQTVGNYHSYTVQVRRSSSMSRLAAKY
ncbi:uncharacterized protein [Parasteatoda tepidariorum]|uniref:uncharacterized protein n=1 Tax=Parasteatoda tepidariorum TaxID=114398 RepID=UPI0039BC402C